VTTRTRLTAVVGFAVLLGLAGCATTGSQPKPAPQPSAGLAVPPAPHELPDFPPRAPRSSTAYVIGQQPPSRFVHAPDFEVELTPREQEVLAELAPPQQYDLFEFLEPEVDSERVTTTRRPTVHVAPATRPEILRGPPTRSAIASPSPAPSPQIGPRTRTVLRSPLPAGEVGVGPPTVRGDDMVGPPSRVVGPPTRSRTW
jgi:hypothetical protein